MRLCICILICLSLMLSAAVAAPAPQAYHKIKTITIGGDGGWDYLTFDSATHRLYIARATRVQVVDVDKGTLVGEVPNTQGVHGVALVPAIRRGFASNGKNDSVTVFDLASLKEVARVKVGTRPDAIVNDIASKRVFTMNAGSEDATAIDVATNKVVGTIALGGKPEFAVADGKGTIFVNIEDKSEVVSFDSKTLAVKNRWPLAPGEEPSGLAMDLKNRRLFSVCSNEKMVVTDADTGKVLATPTIGKGPDAAAFDPSTGLAFSSNGQDGTLTIVREKSPNEFVAVETVPTQLGARTMALDPITHNIYLATASFIPMPPPTPGQRRQRPTILPDSFVILVFGP